ncbi:hypothetical protein ACS0TY_001585 [Phlomoides rotata]
MISAKKLIKIVPKLQKFQRNERSEGGVVDKGHFAIYTADDRRFVVPLTYLNHPVFRQLLKMSEEEYGLPSDGPIVLPCDFIFMDFVICLIRQGRAAHLYEALLKLNHCTLSSLYQGQMNQQSLVH